MRKLLLATAAIMGATGGLAMAQSAPNPIQGSYAGPMGGYSSGYSSLGSISTYESGSPSIGPGSMSGVKPPAMQPGTVKIHLNGRLENDFGYARTSLDTYPNPAGGYNKTNGVALSTYLRLYPGFDGIAANGLRYGAAAEIRMNYPGNGSTTGAISTTASGNSSNQTLYVRRQFAYLASDQIGLLRIGGADGIIGLLDNGVFSSQLWDAGTGNFNGGAGESMMTGNVAGMAGDWPWLTWAGQEYASGKLVYMSPQFYGFDFGVDYTPNDGNGYSANNCNVSSAAACIVASSSGATADSRYINRVSVGARYQHAFDMVDVKLMGYYTTAGKVSNTTTAQQDNISLYDFGAAVTAFNTTLAVDYSGGANNGGLFMKPKGAPNENSILVGATYRNGPLTLGAEFETIDMAGNGGLAQYKMGTQHEYGATFGANYALAPGLNLTAEYIYIHRHQGDWNYATKTAGLANNDAQGQAFTVSTVVTW